MFKQPCYVTVSKHYTATLFSPDALDSYLLQASYPDNVDHDFGRIVKIGEDWTEEALNTLKGKIAMYIWSNTNLRPVAAMCTPRGLRWDPKEVLWYPKICTAGVGGFIAIERNQAWRQAEIMAVKDEQQILVCYDMPKGARYMNIIDLFKWDCYGNRTYRTISLNALKKNKKWMRLIPDLSIYF